MRSCGKAHSQLHWYAQASLQSASNIQACTGMKVEDLLLEIKEDQLVAEGKW
jgi:hypothetical protein